MALKIDSKLMALCFLLDVDVDDMDADVDDPGPEAAPVVPPPPIVCVPLLPLPVSAVESMSL